MTKELLININQTADHFLSVLQSFPEEQFNTVPFKGSWTAAQVAEHLLKSNTGILKVLYGKVEQTKRPPNEKVVAITKLFLDFSLHMKSSEAMLPSTTPQQKDIILKALENKINDLSEAAATFNVSATCLDFEFPGFGRLTMLEWLSFFVCHTQRHTHQMKNIYQILENKSFSSYPMKTT